MVELTLQLTDQEYALLRKIADYSHVTPEQLLKEAAQLTLPAILVAVPDVSALSDQEVLRLAQATMSDAEYDRLDELRRLPTPMAAEREELARLQMAYWVGQFTKTEAMIEAHKRGLL